MSALSIVTNALQHFHLKIISLSFGKQHFIHQGFVIIIDLMEELYSTLLVPGSKS